MRIDLGLLETLFFDLFCRYDGVRFTVYGQNGVVFVAPEIEVFTFFLDVFWWCRNNYGF